MKHSRVLFLFACAFVIPLSIAQTFVDATVLVYVLLPGDLVSLLFTGGHGGTLAQEWIGAVCGALVNLVIYWGAFAGLWELRGRVPRRGT